MRVVAGSAGGLHLVAPEGIDTRPTSDRVREATFNALGSLGLIEGATVLDLYAGSGAMGIEALSRGAAHATFVDSHPAAIAAIRTNLRTTGFTDRATVHRGDATAVMHRGPFDLAILDPPYVFDGWDALLAQLPAAVAVIESGRPVALGSGWVEVRSKRYGTTVVTIARQERDHHVEAP